MSFWAFVGRSGTVGDGGRSWKRETDSLGSLLEIAGVSWTRALEIIALPFLVLDRRANLPIEHSLFPLAAFSFHLSLSCHDFTWG